MDLNALLDFQLVATHGGFGKASRASGRSKATLSRRVSDLEEGLGLRLMERGGHALVLTEAGETLLTRTTGPMHEVEEAVAAARDGLGAPRGRLRVAAPLLFSQVALGRLAAAFVALYPEVRLEVVAGDRFVDLVDEQFDVAIRVNPGEDGSLVGRCFARDQLVLAAARSIRKPRRRAGEPPAVPAVVMPTYRDGDRWSLNGDALVVAPRPVLRLSTLPMVRDAVLAGAGAALLPRSIVGSSVASGDLSVWGAVGDEVQLWVLHTSRRLQSPKVRAFVDFLCAQYPGGTFDAAA